jgi:predicted dehydrogenase
MSLNATPLQQLDPAVYAAIATGRPSERPVYATFADGHEEMVVGDAIKASAESGRWVSVARAAAMRQPIPDVVPA